MTAAVVVTLAPAGPPTGGKRGSSGMGMDSRVPVSRLPAGKAGTGPSPDGRGNDHLYARMAGGGSHSRESGNPELIP
jgi:hypothetical protein